MVIVVIAALFFIFRRAPGTSQGGEAVEGDSDAAPTRIEVMEDNTMDDDTEEVGSPMGEVVTKKTLAERVGLRGKTGPYTPLAGQDPTSPRSRTNSAAALL